MITQREFFNSMAEKWDTFCRHDTNKIKYILDLLDIGRGANILDVGTGTGILVPFLSEQVGENGGIVAIDVSEKMLEIAKRKYPLKNVAFVCGDILEADLPKEFFDFAICYSVFPHFEDKQLAVRAISKYLEKDGMFVICHSQSRESINNLHRSASEAVAEDNLPDAGIIKSYFSKAGLHTTIEIDNSELFVVAAKK